jgi:acetyl-CoA acetyltransferase
LARDAPGRHTLSGVEIAGVGLHPFGRFGDTPATALGVGAAEAALADAGWTPAEARGRIGAAYCATAYGGVASGHRVLGALALTGIPIVDVEAGCASGGAALALASASIGSGQHEAVLVVGVEKMPKGIIRSSFFAPWQEEAGLNANPAYFALRAQWLLREHGLAVDDLAALVVKNRRWGARNPDAMFRAEVTAEEVLASRIVCDPLRLWMLCSPNEGAAAVVLRRGDGGVQLAAVALRSHLPGSVLDESTPLSGLADDGDIVPPTTLAATDAYEAAGVDPEDLDVVECQDTDAGRELLSWYELGLCAAGDQRKLLGAETGPGEPPGPAINRSGGLLSKGEPLGASALGQVVELVRQLGDRAGDRQVPNARVGLAHTIGRGANASVTVVAR